MTPAQRTKAIKLSKTSGFSKAERGYAKQEQAQPKRVELLLTGDGPTVKARQRIEQTIALVTAQALLDAGFLLGVNDGEETTLEFSRDINAVQKALFTTDDDYLYVYESGRNLREKDKRPDYWVRFVYGNVGWDVISDYSNTADLNPIIGDGTVVDRLVEHASEYGTVPDLYYRNEKIVTV